MRNHGRSGLSYTRAVTTISRLAAMLLGAAAPAFAQPAEKIQVVLDVRSEGRADADAAATRLRDHVRHGLAAIGDVELVPADGVRRIIWIVMGTTPGAYAASVIVTERYDRETLMVLGIEDDDMAHRMMALQIVADHQIFTGRSTAALATRIVTAIDEGALNKVRAFTRRALLVPPHRREALGVAHPHVDEE